MPLIAGFATNRVVVLTYLSHGDVLQIWPKID